MSTLLVLEQTLNGIQFGVFLFLISAGLTLVLGIMNVVNLAHGALFMMGAYFASTFVAWTGSFFIAFLLIIPSSVILGIIIEILTLRPLYLRDHMDQVLATFGLILFFNEGVKLVWGVDPQPMPTPELFSGNVEIFPDAPYPVFRLFIIGIGLLVAAVIYFLIAKTKVGMLIRAGASNTQMIRAMGVNIRFLNTFVFGLGAFFAGLAGLMAAPIISVESGMGDEMLILAFVVIVIGGIGSVRGALVASVIIGVFEVVGRSMLPIAMQKIFPLEIAQTAGPAIASMLIYILMAGVLFFKPQGLFPARTG